MECFGVEGHNEKLANLRGRGCLKPDSIHAVPGTFNQGGETESSTGDL